MVENCIKVLIRLTSALLKPDRDSEVCRSAIEHNFFEKVSLKSWTKDLHSFVRSSAVILKPICDSIIIRIKKKYYYIFIIGSH